MFPRLKGRFDDEHINTLQLALDAISKFDGSKLIEVSHNLLSLDNLEEGVLTRGEVTPNSLFWTTRPITLAPNTNFIIESGNNTSASIYDASDNYIEGYSASVIYPQVSPQETSTIRISFRKDEIDTTQFYLGVAKKDYADPGIKYSNAIFSTEFIQRVEDILEGAGNGNIGMYDKTLNKTNTYINFTTGAEQSSSDWQATAPIPMIPGALYLKTIRGQSAYYDDDNEYAGGSGNRVEDMMFTMPPNGRYARFSIPTGKENDFKLIKLDDDKVSPVKGIFKELLNPFKQSYIKMIGDSNVAGSGGTGYSTSDSSHGQAPGYSDRYFNEDGYCWANELKNFLIDDFQGDQVVGLNHTEIKPLKRTPVTSYDNSAKSSYVTGVNTNSPVEFEFYGTAMTLFTTQSTGAVEIRIDGTLERTMSSFNNINQPHRFDVPLGIHKVEIKVTSGTVNFTGIQLYKRVVAKNFGVSGVSTDYIIRRINELLDGDETIVMCLVGSNDRIANAYADTTSQLVENFKMIYLSIINSGAKPVFISSTPASVSNETDLERDFDKGDVDTATAVAAATFGYEHISVYNYILEYCEMTGTTIDSLLSDGVHPNDEGYRLAFNYICKEIGIGRKRPDATW